MVTELFILQVDLDKIDLKEFPDLAKLEGQYAIVKEGEMLYIPPRCCRY